jgi:phosphatidylserine/phosphatidylglycerophosphate/cardiolipin synthase-like enzyme
MMSKLLYHPPDNPVSESPFDRAIIEIAMGQDVKIVSPYLSLRYLERIVGISRSWQLISDVFEWLSATPDRERDAVYEFLKANEGSVHYYPAIHAKTVISQAAAYTGSANLTDAGVLRRTEFGILLRDKAQIDEIHQWFAALWAQTSPPALDGVQELVASLNQITSSPFVGSEVQDFYLESNALRVRAKLVKLLGEQPVPLAAIHKKRASDGTFWSQPTTKVEALASCSGSSPVTATPNIDSNGPSMGGRIQK